MESNAKNNPMPNINDIPDALFTRAEFREELSEEAGFSNYSYWRSTIRTFFKSTVVKVIVALLIALVAYTVIYPMITDRDPYAVALSAREWNLPPSAEHPFGTDGVGRDIWARVWFGTRTSLLLSLAVAFFEVGLGVIIGAIWGFYRKLDTLMFAIYKYPYQRAKHHLPCAYSLYYEAQHIHHYDSPCGNGLDKRGALVPQPHIGPARGGLQHCLNMP